MSRLALGFAGAVPGDPGGRRAVALRASGGRPPRGRPLRRGAGHPKAPAALRGGPPGPGVALIRPLGAHRPPASRMSGANRCSAEVGGIGSHRQRWLCHPKAHCLCLSASLSLRSSISRWCTIVQGLESEGFYPYFIQRFFLFLLLSIKVYKF